MSSRSSNGRYETLEYRNIKHHSDLADEVTIGIAACVDSAFGGRITIDDAYDHMRGDQLLVARDHQKRVLGFAATTIVSPNELLETDEYTDESGAYFAAAAVRGDSQGHGIYGTFSEARIKYALENGVNLLYTRTQNPQVQETIDRTLARVGELEGFVVASMERVLLPSFYGRMLTAEKPAAHDTSFPELNYENGDAFLISWNIK